MHIRPIRAVVYDYAYLLTVTSMEIPVVPRYGKRFLGDEVKEYVNGDFVLLRQMPGQPGRMMAVRWFDGDDEAALNPLASTYAQRKILGHALLMDVGQYDEKG